MTANHTTFLPDASTRLGLLSPREREVLRLVALGRTNAEVAAELVIAVATVKTHVAQLLRKLRARDRVALVVLAWRDALVDESAREHAAPRSRRAGTRHCHLTRLAG